MMMKDSSDGKVHVRLAARWLAFVLGASIVAMALFGVIRAYSPVPFWDMWDGYIGFFYRVQDGVPKAWWGQHNEHRIFLARVLFWADLHWFRGQGIFLLVVNASLAACTGILFCRAARWALRGTGGESSAPLIYALLLATAFFWSQENNLTWGFQSQFLLAQLLPATALYCLARSRVSESYGTRWFLAGTALGIASAGTMANGPLALPVMLVFAMVAGLSWRRVIFLAVLACATLLAYFQSYVAVGTVPLSSVLLSEPVEAAKFVLMYLGSPVYFALMHVRGAGVAAMVAGAVLVAIAAFRTVTIWRERRQHPLDLAMLAFLMYIGATACGTALGRVASGLAQALSSRYTTPALMAWMATIILVLPWFVNRPRRAGWAGATAIVLLLAMVPYQRTALASRANMRFDRMLAASALTLGVRDEPAIGQVYPFTDVALSLADRAQRDRISVFGNEPLVGARDRIGTNEVFEGAACEGHVDTSDVVAHNRFALRVSGWVARRAHGAPDRIDIVDAHGRVVGLAVDGQPNPQGDGFIGYLVEPPAPGDLKFVVRRAGCQFVAKLPFALSTVLEAPHAAPGLVPIQRIVGPSTFLGTDIDQSHFGGIDVVGSMKTSDRDMGAVRLTLHRGEFLYYRTGPTPGRQTISVPGVFDERLLPLAVQWHRLVLDDPRLPDTFDAVIADHGDGWGEWSAIALASAAADP